MSAKRRQLGPLTCLSTRYFWEGLNMQWVRAQLGQQKKTIEKDKSMTGWRSDMHQILYFILYVTIKTTVVRVHIGVIVTTTLSPDISFCFSCVKLVFMVRCDLTYPHCVFLSATYLQCGPKPTKTSKWGTLLPQETCSCLQKRKIFLRKTLGLFFFVKQQRSSTLPL